MIWEGSPYNNTLNPKPFRFQTRGLKQKTKNLSESQACRGRHRPLRRLRGGASDRNVPLTEGQVLGLTDLVAA